MKVLLVCENPRVAASVAAALASGDTAIDQVRTPQRALTVLDDGEHYDLVVGDNDTTPTGGFALSREIKARSRMGAAMPPVLLLLARDQDKWLSNWSQADAYVRKPADPFDLAEAAAALVEDRPIPQLPGVGGSPTPSLLDVPGPEHDPGEAAEEALPQGREHRDQEDEAEAMRAGKRDIT